MRLEIILVKQDRSFAEWSGLMTGLMSEGGGEALGPQFVKVQSS